ncbi:MAG TPA: Ldh family oxidoreductase [Methylomirabilota bacterium]|nr:Ldh family oxidoreductase [Methylomirabilota bacterium]
MPPFKADQLVNFSERLLSAGGIPSADSQLVAKLLVKGELRGYPGHGVTRVAQYLSFIKNGTINIRERPRVVREGKTTAVIDGNHYIGQVVACEGMQLAIKKAKEHGAGMVTIRRAGHSGRLADYMEMAAGEGMIAMGAVSVGSGTTALYGGMERVSGTNPMAFGIPARDGRHILLDFATASMSMGEIQKRVARKNRIPDGVMLDGYGNPTNDFKTFRGPPRGVFLPFGGYKGSGVALVTEILGGILSGNGPSKDWWDKGGHGVNGVFLQAFAVEEFQALDQFLDKVDEFIAFVKSTKPAPGFKEILLPGEHARASEARQLKDGVQVDEATWTELKELASELGVGSLPMPI